MCFKCHGNHKSKECNEEILLCVNCVNENKRLNLGLDENHVTNSHDCPMYHKKLNFNKRRICLST